MLELEIVPGVRIGPFELGLSDERLGDLCRAIGGFQQPRQLTPLPPGYWAFEFGMFVKARFDGSGIAESVQVSGSGAFTSFNPHFRGLNLLTTPAVEVIELLSGLDHLTGDEYGFYIGAPQLGISLARKVVPEDEDDEDGRCFTSVLVAIPGSTDLL